MVSLRPDTDRARPRGAHRVADRRRPWALVLVVGIVLVVGAAATGLLLVWGGVFASGPVDLHGNRVVLDPGDTADPVAQEKQDPVDSGQGRFEVPSVGLDVPLGALSEADGQIVPPGFTSVYWVRNRGVDVDVDRADTGTVFVVTHSLRGGGTAPGNYLIDVNRGTSAVTAGAIVRVDGISYTVDGGGAVNKADLATDAEVWANTPNRLVIITCLQVPAGTASVDNLVITATRTP